MFFFLVLEAKTVAAVNCKGDVTRDDLQQRFLLSATQHCNIVVMLFRIVTTLFQHCNPVLR